MSEYANYIEQSAFEDGLSVGRAEAKQRIKALQQQIDAVLEICREVSDDWAPEHPPYAAQEMIERIREKLGKE